MYEVCIFIAGMLMPSIFDLFAHLCKKVQHNWLD